MPNLGSARQDGQRSSMAHGTISFNNVISGGVEIPLAWDVPTEAEVVAGTAPSLSDWNQQGWRLRRFVGKLHLRLIDSTTNDGQVYLDSDAVVTASLIVRRVDSTGNALAAANFSEIENDLANNIRDPFIWRRSWVLNNQESFTDANGDTTYPGRFPDCNSKYGSALDGPHIDQKTNRVISNEERLFMDITATWGYWDLDPDQYNYNCELRYYLDYRMIGSTMRSTNRRNASR